MAGGRRSAVQPWLRKAPRRLVWVCVGIAAGGLVVLVIWVLPLVLTRHPSSANAGDRYKAINDTRTGLVAAVIAVGAAGGLGYTARTYRLSQQGQFTDRYAKAIEQLGNRDSVEVRLGGIYALERLMRDSKDDQPTIVEVLAAYVREKARAPVPTSLGPATDVQAALTVLGRRTPVDDETHIDLEGAHLENAQLPGARLEGVTLAGARLELAMLAGAHLENAKLPRANLDGASLIAAHLEGASLAGAHLKGAMLARANLEHASLTYAELENASLQHANLERAFLMAAHLESATLAHANLRDANLVSAHLNEANLEGAHLERTWLERASLQGAHLEGADLTTAFGVTQAQVYSAILDKDTKIPAGLVHPFRDRGMVPEDF
jgi:uncharacterized protein YjbI with pentapeptide repeats